MALTNQPYFPFYVDDYLSDEKLNQCEPSSEGIYTRILCVMHKSKDYGSIVLSVLDKTKLKQKASKIEAKDEQKQNKELLMCLEIKPIDFYTLSIKVASMVSRDITNVIDALVDLLSNDVLQFNNSILSQKRMKNDGDKSKIKANNASKPKQTKKQNKNKPKTNNQTKPEQIPVYEYVIVNENEFEIEFENGKKIPTEKIFIEYGLDRLKSNGINNPEAYESALSNKYHAWRENNWHTGGKENREIKVWKTTLNNTLGYLKPNEIKTHESNFAVN